MFPAMTAVREPPHSLDLERAILSVVAVGTHGGAMGQLLPAVAHPLLFWNRDHRLIWLACLELHDGGTTPDAPAIADLLGRLRFDAALDRLREAQTMAEADDLDKADQDGLRQLWRWEERDRTTDEGESVLAAIGGAQAVYALADAPGSYTSLARNGQLLRDHYLKRRLIGRLGLIADEARRTSGNFADVVKRASETVLDLGRLDSTTSVHGMAQVADETLEVIQRRMHEPDSGVRTGLEDIDSKLGSLRPGGFYVLAARPGVGKTSLALRMVQSIVAAPDNPQRVLFFSLEVDRTDLVKKLIAAYGKLPFKDLDMGTLPPELFDRLTETLKIVKQWPMEMMDVADLTVHQLRSVVKRRMLETGGGIKLIVIDYLQLLQSSNREQEEYAKVSEITRVLKVLALELKLPVLALSQMSRDSEKGTAPREPRLSDLRGSGSIEQDADAVLFIHRVDTEDQQGPDAFRTIKIRIAKNRFGPTGDTLMHFFPAKLSFEQAAAEPEEDEDGEGGAPAYAHRGKRRPQKPAGGEDLFADDAPAP